MQDGPVFRGQVHGKLPSIVSVGKAGSGADRASTCVICGPTLAQVFYATGGFDIVKCSRCHLVYVDNCTAIEGLDAFYTAPYFHAEGDLTRGYRDYMADRDLHLWNANAILDLIDRYAHVPGRRLLDVGCAHGFFLEAARKRAWAGRGVDIAANAVAYAREKLGLDVHLGEIEQLKLESESVDLVTMIGTIEHFRDPLRTVRAAVDALVPGGVLVVTTIDVEGALGYFSWKPPEHLHYFSFKTLARLIEEAGMQIMWKRTHWCYYRFGDLLSRLWAYWGFSQSVRWVRWLERLRLERLSVKIPTNEIVVFARKAVRLPT